MKRNVIGLVVLALLGGVLGLLVVQELNSDAEDSGEGWTPELEKELFLQCQNAASAGVSAATSEAYCECATEYFTEAYSPKEFVRMGVGMFSASPAQVSDKMMREVRVGNQSKMTDVAMELGIACMEKTYGLEDYIALVTFGCNKNPSPSVTAKSASSFCDCVGDFFRKTTTATEFLAMVHDIIKTGKGQPNAAEAAMNCRHVLEPIKN